MSWYLFCMGYILSRVFNWVGCERVGLLNNYMYRYVYILNIYISDRWIKISSKIHFLNECVWVASWERNRNFPKVRTILFALISRCVRCRLLVRDHCRYVYNCVLVDLIQEKHVWIHVLIQVSIKVQPENLRLRKRV